MSNSSTPNFLQHQQHFFLFNQPSIKFWFFLMLINLSHNSLHHLLQFLKITILLYFLPFLIFTLQRSSKIINSINHFPYLHLLLILVRNLKFVYVFMLSLGVCLLNLAFFEFIVLFVLIDTIKSTKKQNYLTVNVYHLIISVTNWKYASS